jgi:hypothetical protein
LYGEGRFRSSSSRLQPAAVDGEDSAAFRTRPAITVEVHPHITVHTHLVPAQTIVTDTHSRVKLYTYTRAYMSVTCILTVMYARESMHARYSIYAHLSSSTLCFSDLSDRYLCLDIHVSRINSFRGIYNHEPPHGICSSKGAAHRPHAGAERDEDLAHGRELADELEDAEGPEDAEEGERAVARQSP